MLVKILQLHQQQGTDSSSSPSPSGPSHDPELEDRLSTDERMSFDDLVTADKLDDRLNSDKDDRQTHGADGSGSLDFLEVSVSDPLLLL